MTHERRPDLGTERREKPSKKEVSLRKTAPGTRPARGGSGPERAHWEEAVCVRLLRRAYQYRELDEGELKVMKLPNEILTKKRTTRSIGVKSALALAS